MRGGAQVMAAELKGILPAIASPCDERDLFLEDEFGDLATGLYEQGVHGLYVCGATGDGYNMRLEERKRAAEIAVDRSRKYSGKVIVHVGTSNSGDAIELAEHASEAGACAVSSMPPANRNLDQLVSYYTDIARASQIPTLVYHIPMLTGRSLTVDEMLRLLDIDGVVGLKFSDWNLFYIRQLLIARPDITVFNGMDEFLCPGFLYGSSGGIGLNYNLFPRLFLGIYEAVNGGDIARAMELQNTFLAYANLIWRYGVLPTFEIMMREMWHAPHCWRRPRAVMSSETTARFLAEARPTLNAIEEAVSVRVGSG